MSQIDELKLRLSCMRQGRSKEYKDYRDQKAIIKSDIEMCSKNYNNAIRTFSYIQKKYPENSKEYIQAKSEVYRWNDLLNQGRLEMQFVRPNTQEDIAYRNDICENFVNELQQVIDPKLDLRYHGTPIYYAEQIIKSGNISSTADRYDGYIKSTDLKGEISVTDIQSLDRTIGLFTNLLSYNKSLPAGCVFAILPKDKADAENAYSSMSSVNFKNNPQQLFGIFTTPENIKQVKEWMQESGFNPNLVCTFEEFLHRVEEKQEIKNDSQNEYIDFNKNTSLVKTKKNPIMNALENNKIFQKMIVKNRRNPILKGRFSKLIVEKEEAMKYFLDEIKYNYSEFVEFIDEISLSKLGIQAILEKEDSINVPPEVKEVLNDKIKRMLETNNGKNIYEVMRERLQEGNRNSIERYSESLSKTEEGFSLIVADKSMGNRSYPNMVKDILTVCNMDKVFEIMRNPQSLSKEIIKNNGDFVNESICISEIENATNNIIAEKLLDENFIDEFSEKVSKNQYGNFLNSLLRTKKGSALVDRNISEIANYENYRNLLDYNNGRKIILRHMDEFFDPKKMNGKNLLEQMLVNYNVEEGEFFKRNCKLILDYEKACENEYSANGKFYDKFGSLNLLVKNNIALSEVVDYCMNEEWSELNEEGMSNRIQNMIMAIEKQNLPIDEKEEELKGVQDKILLEISRSIKEIQHSGVNKNFHSSRIEGIYSLMDKFENPDILSEFEKNNNDCIFHSSSKYIDLSEEEREKLDKALYKYNPKNNYKEFIGKGKDVSVWKISDDCVIKIGKVGKDIKHDRILESIESSNGFKIQPYADTKMPVDEEEMYECWAELLDSGYIHTDVAERNYGRKFSDKKVILIDDGYIFEKGEQIRVPDITNYYKFMERYKSEINSRKTSLTIDDLNQIEEYDGKDSQYMLE